MANSILRGAKLIGKALGVSDRTVREYIKAGKLPATKAGDNTSPLIVRREDVERLKRARGARKVA